MSAESNITYSQWTVDDTRSFFGDTIPFSYNVGGVSYSDNFHFVGASVNDAVLSVDIESNSVVSDTTLSTYQILTYVSSVNSNLGSSHAELIIPLSIYHGGGLRFFAGSVSSFANVLAANFVGNAIASNPANFVEGDFAARAPASATYPDYYNAALTKWRNGGDYKALTRLLTYDGVGGIISGLHYDNVLSDGLGRFYFFVATPYSYGNVSHDSPSITTTITSVTSPPVVTTNINIDVDMSETNGLLDQIKQGISGLAQSILDGLKGLFVPSDNFLEAFKSDMDNLLASHLGGLYQASTLMVDMFGDFDDVVGKNDIYIPPVDIPLAGSTLTLGDWHVPLKVDGIPSILYEGLAFIIDFLALMSFLRMCSNKLDIFLNPDSEVVRE